MCFPDERSRRFITFCSRVGEGPQMITYYFLEERMGKEKEMAFVLHANALRYDRYRWF